jgi:hypothetical protein
MPLKYDKSKVLKRNKDFNNPIDATRLASNYTDRKFEIAQSKKPTTDEYNWAKAAQVKEPEAAVDNYVRDWIPLPKNAASLVMKKSINENKMNTNSLKDSEKAVMAKVAFNAYKRTGKLHGGTEYEDYKGTTNGDLGYQEIMNAKAGKVNPVLGTLLAGHDPGYRMATTVGRGMYTINPKNMKDVIYTDGYDFVNKFTKDEKTGKTKKDYFKETSSNPLVAFYQKIRKNLAFADDNLKNPDDYKAKFKLNASDTLNLPSRN